MTTKNTGGLLKRFICNDCARKAGVEPKHPAESGRQSWLCGACQHYGIGSTMICEVGDWLAIVPRGYPQEAL